VGEERARTVDVRVLAATHRDPEALVRAGAFREDLYYRLKVVELRVPSLRERPEDVPVLARHFLDRYAERFGVAPLRIPEGLLDALAARAWPGNVRELENAVESLVALSPPAGLDAALLPAPAGAETGPPLSLRRRVEAYERGLLVEALREARGNRSEAARRLGVSRVTLHDKLAKYGVAREDGEV
jgi:DNA-binding NtrC family response regulator